MSTLPFQISPALFQDRPDAHLDRALRRSVAVGLALVLLVPLARASTDWLGWLPLWLVGMPAVAWWALHRFRLPAGWTRVRRSVQRRRSPQARRIRLGRGAGRRAA